MTLFDRLIKTDFRICNRSTETCNRSTIRDREPSNIRRILINPSYVVIALQRQRTLTEEGFDREALHSQIVNVVGVFSSGVSY